MDRILYLLVRAFLGLLQSLPLTWLARFGRTIGGLAHWLDARHRRVARRSLGLCFPEKSPAEIRALTRENFKRIGENFACAIKTGTMNAEQIRTRLEVVGLEEFVASGQGQGPKSRIVAIGHFGNFEAFAQLARLVPWAQGATTYRALDVPVLDKLLLALRESSGCLFFERRREGEALRIALREKSLVLALLSDQHAGDTGLRLTFFGRECSTSRAPAVFALRYNVPLYTAICYRTGLARWKVEVGDSIPLHQANGEPRTMADIMQDVNHAFEVAVRRDPANWFWVHNRWKPFRRPKAAAEPASRGNVPAPESSAPPVD